MKQLNAAVGGVAFPALSRIQHDAERLARSFLRGFSLLISSTIPITISLRPVCGGDRPHCAGREMDGGGANLQAACPGSVGVRSGKPVFLVGHVHGPGRTALSISTATTPFVIVGIVLGLSHGPKGVALGYSLAMTLVVIPIAAWSKLRHRNHLGGSLESRQTTVSVRFARRCGGLARKAHARWQVATNTLFNGGAWSCFRHLRMGSSDCHEAETRVHGLAVPAIATARGWPGKNRQIGHEVDYERYKPEDGAVC